jgi:hypothetical protein
MADEMGRLGALSGPGSILRTTTKEDLSVW